MTTIDVLPLSDDLSGDNADNAPDNSEKDAIIIENVEKIPSLRSNPPNLHLKTSHTSLIGGIILNVIY